MLSPATADAGTTAHRSGGNSFAGLEPARSDVDWVAFFRENSLGGRHLSASTVEAYTLDLAMLSRWAAGQGQSLLELDTAALRDYVIDRTAHGTRLSTLARHLSTYRRFYSVLVGHGVLAVNPAAAVLVPKAPRLQPSLVGEAAVRSLLLPPPAHFLPPASAYRVRRDHAIVCMLYGAGLGVSDVRLLRWQQIDEQGCVVRASSGTGARRSVVLDPALPVLLTALRRSAAMNTFNLAGSPYCFPTTTGLPMTRQALCHAVRRWAIDRGLAQVVTPSALRQAGRANGVIRRPSQPVLAPAAHRCAHRPGLMINDANIPV